MKGIVYRVSLACLCFVLLSLACSRPPDIVPLPPSYSPRELSKVPVILVGQAIANSHAAGPWQRSRWDRSTLQLWTVRILLEHVLSGQVNAKEIDVFYFAQNSLPGSVRSLGQITSGSSLLFLLEYDQGMLQTICNFEPCILPIRTGTHADFRRDPKLSLEDTIQNLLLARGDHTTDQQMIDSIGHPELYWGTAPVISRLRLLVNVETSPPVSTLARATLNRFEKEFGNGTLQVPHS